MHNKGPDHKRGFKRPWLIQRLNKPFPRKEDNPLVALMGAFSFGGGLKNGGLTEEAMALLGRCFSFDYMGATEFEWGAVPAALAYIAKNRKKYETFELPVTTEEECDALLLCIIPTAFKDEIRTFLLHEVYKDRYGDLKEYTKLHATIQGEKYNERLGGWLELDNGFMFFTDNDMYCNVVSLFDLTLPNEDKP